MSNYFRHEDPSTQYLTPRTVATMNTERVTRDELLAQLTDALKAFDQALNPGQRALARHDVNLALSGIATAVGLESDPLNTDARDVTREIEAGTTPPVAQQMAAVHRSVEFLSKELGLNAKPPCKKCGKVHA